MDGCRVGKIGFCSRGKDPHPLGLVQGPVHREEMARKLPLFCKRLTLPIFGRVGRLIHWGASQEVRERGRGRMKQLA